MQKDIRAKIRAQPPKASLAAKGLEAETRTSAVTETL
jgi:hypothetical protein